MGVFCMIYLYFMTTLNNAQRQAVEHTDGPLLILAGAGAGKTKTLTERVIQIVKNGTLPKQILCITFTNKAAREMSNRIIHRLTEEGLYGGFQTYKDLPTIKTFHSLGVLILREQSEHLGLPRQFTIMDPDDALHLIRDIIKERGLDTKVHDPSKYRFAISRMKGDFLSPTTIKEKSQSYNHDLLASVWEEYEAELKKQRAVDFDDLIIKTVVLLRDNTRVREYYQERFKYIHIDEYQDTNKSQYEMGRLLSERHKNICVVGDADQNIYSWRGANISNILNFEKDYANARTILLEQNYRSTKNILTAANAVIEKNEIRAPKKLFTESPEGDFISIVENWDETAEANFVAQKCFELIEKGVDAKDIAVLYRANFQSRILEEAFLHAGAPYQVLGVRFFERKEVKDVLSYLRSALNENSIADMTRALSFPTRGIGKVTLARFFTNDIESIPASQRAKLAHFQKLLASIRENLETKALSETIEFIIKESGIEAELLAGDATDLERLENIRELVSVATKYDAIETQEALERFLEESTLVSDQDTVEERSAVRLMTVHAAKGLEFPYVFIVGAEQDLFPYKRINVGKQTKEEKEEERRLMYVAITRAEKKLYITYAGMRTKNGERNFAIPSEFIQDIPEEVTEHEKGGDRNTGGRIIYVEL